MGAEPSDAKAIAHSAGPGLTARREGPLRDRILTWRAYAQQALDELAGDAGDTYEADPDEPARAAALARGLMSAGAAAFPIQGAVLRPFFQTATADLLVAVGRRPPSARPVDEAQKIIELAVDHAARAYCDGLADAVKETWTVLDLIHDANDGPAGEITEERLFNWTCGHLFGTERISGAGFQTEVVPEAVRRRYRSAARAAVEEYLRR
ncbi:MAG TPA: hypothetical protein VKI19_11890 [Acidimicrobiales bacterium]|nr:hypothetical protein [Acidimicrobiales bacterium]